MPSLRRRSLSSKSRSIVRGSIRGGSAVSWWMTASGRAAATASVHRAGVERVGHHRLGALGAQRLALLRGAAHRGHLVALREQERHERAADHAGGAGEEDPHAALSAAGGASGTMQTMPSLKPAGPMSKATLKRERRFSRAIRFVSSTIWRSLEVLAQGCEQLVADLRRRARHRHRVVEHEPLELVEGVALAVAGQGEQLLLGEPARRASAEPMSTQNSQPSRAAAFSTASTLRRSSTACGSPWPARRGRSRSAAAARARTRRSGRRRGPPCAGPGAGSGAPRVGRRCPSRAWMRVIGGSPFGCGPPAPPARTRRRAQQPGQRQRGGERARRSRSSPSSAGGRCRCRPGG